MATIEMRGIMIFRINGSGQVTEVVMPDTRKNPPGRHRNDIFGPQHHDGRKAARHYAGVLHLFGDKKKHYDISDRAVSFKDKVAFPPANSIRYLADLNKLGKAEALSFDAAAPRIATIDFSLPAGATIETKAPAVVFTMNGAAVHLFVLITFPGAVTLLGADDDEIVIGANDQAFIYHFDERKPSKEELQEEKGPPEVTVVDQDFKWLYANLKWKNPGDIGEWVDEVDPIGGFPAPLFRPPQVGIKTVSVSTCFPGRFEG